MCALQSKSEASLVTAHELQKLLLFLTSPRVFLTSPRVLHQVLQPCAQQHPGRAPLYCTLCCWSSLCSEYERDTLAGQI